MLPTTDEEIEALNDAFAREHDIDAYYEASGFAIRAIERRRLAIIRDMMRAKRGDRILEVGCGGGHVLALFPEAKLTGVDVSGTMLEKAERNLHGYDFVLLKGSIDKLGLEDESFDGIVCTEVLEHVTEPERILTEIRRLARRGARIVVTFPNDRLIHGIKDTIRTLRLTALPPFRRIAWGGDHYHFHVWSIPEMRALLSRYFDVLDENFSPTAALPIRACFRCVKRS